MKSQKTETQKYKNISRISKFFVTSLPSFVATALIFVLAVSFFGISFGISDAATSSGIVPCNPTFNGSTNTSSSNSTTYTDLTDKCGWEQLIKLGQNILDYAITLMALLSVIGIAYAGFLYMSSGGDSGKIKKAHGIFTKIIWGIFFVLGAYLIVKSLLTGLGYGQNGFTSILS